MASKTMKQVRKKRWARAEVKEEEKWLSYYVVTGYVYDRATKTHVYKEMKIRAGCIPSALNAFEYGEIDPQQVTAVKCYDQKESFLRLATWVKASKATVSELGHRKGDKST